jgi:hypothetical protein
MTLHVRDSCPDGGGIGHIKFRGKGATRTNLPYPSMHPESPGGHDKDGHIWASPRNPALDVEKLFSSEVRAEARLRHNGIGRFQGHKVPQNRTVSVSDIGKGRAVNDGGGPFLGLHEVWPESLPEKCGHGPVHAKVRRAEKPAIPAPAKGDGGQPDGQFFPGAGKGQNGHDLA